MVLTLAELVKLSDQELISRHDVEAPHAPAATTCCLDELDRRSQKRATDAANRLATRGFWLTVANTAFALVALALRKGG